MFDPRRNERPDFPDNIWEQWEETAKEQFGEDWPRVQQALHALDVHCGIHLLDVHPGNVRLRD